MTDDELKGLLDTMRLENSSAHEETRRRFDAVDARFAELHRHFDVVTEATKHEVRLVAESVAHVNEELKRETTALRQEMSRGFAETQAMIKFSHVELDRRVNVLEESHHALEETVAGLQTRVQRLESGTH
jgi:hypothetical protein